MFRYCKLTILGALACLLHSVPSIAWAASDQVGGGGGGQTVAQALPVQGDRLVLNVYRDAPAAWPSLFITQAEIDVIKERIETDTDYRKAYKKGVVQRGQQAYDFLEKTREKLPRSQETKEHEAVAVALAELALLYAFTQEQQQGELVRDILLEYASFYRDLPIKRPGIDGRLTWQTLDEAMLMVNVAWAYDLIHNSLTATECEQIEKGLLRDAVRVINYRDRERSNWQSWHNAATAAIGFVLRDASIYQSTLDGPRGFLYHVENSFGEDGIWYEQSIAYHYFSLNSMVLLAEMAWRQGIDLYRSEVNGKRLEFMLAAPFYHAMGNLNQPPFGNSQVDYRLIAPWIGWNYACAYARYGDPQYAWLWQQNKPLGSSSLKRHHRVAPLLQLALVDGAAKQEPPAIGSGRPLPGVLNLNGSTEMQSIGLILLRGPAGITTAPELAVTYKPKGTEAGHQHPSNLGLYWQSPAHRWISPSGKWASYTTDIHLNWVKHTISDNTVIVDRRSQYPAYDGAPSYNKDKEGKPSYGWRDHFSNGAVFGYASIGTDAVYENVRLHRRLFHTDRYTLDVYRADSSTTHTYDYVLHVTGHLERSSLPLQHFNGILASASGYGFLSNVRTASMIPVPQGATGLFDARWQTQWSEQGLDETLWVTSFISGAGEAYVGESPWVSRKREFMLLSTEAERSTFVSVLRAGTAVDPVLSVTPLAVAPDSDKSAFRVNLDNATDWLFWAQGEDQSFEQATFRLSATAAALRVSKAQGESEGDTPLSAMLIDGDQLALAGLNLRTDKRTDLHVEWLLEGALLVIHNGAEPVQLSLSAAGTYDAYVVIDGEAQPTPFIRDGTSFALEPLSAVLLLPPSTQAPALPLLKKIFSSKDL